MYVVFHIYDLTLNTTILGFNTYPFSTKAGISTTSDKEPIPRGSRKRRLLLMYVPTPQRV